MKTLAERFWEKVDKRGPDNCWPCKGCPVPGGYVQLTIGPHRRVVAHRVGYELVKGHIPHGTKVLHSCDNPACCNPNHLWLGTQRDNMQDCVAKGRRARTVGKHGNSVKLTEDRVREVRRLFAAGKNQSAIGRLMGVTRLAIGDIIHGRTWKDVS